MPKKGDSSTRNLFLETSFKLIHRKGFQATSLRDILDKTGLTKGALYYHFRDKQSLGYAVVEEYIGSVIRRTWVDPLEKCDDPVECLKNLIDKRMSSMSVPDIELGCPLNNLALEMSPLDEGFRIRIREIYRMWCDNVQMALVRGKELDLVSSSVDAENTAKFIVGSIGGCRCLAKNFQSKEVLLGLSQKLQDYIESLRPA